MCRTFSESSSGSYAGRMAPPGMPKTTSTPTCSSERTRLCAPVIVVLARFAARPTVPATSDGVTVLAPTPCPFLLIMSAPSRRKKRPAPSPAENPAGPLPEIKKPLGPVGHIEGSRAVRTQTARRRTTSSERMRPPCSPAPRVSTDTLPRLATRDGRPGPGTDRDRRPHIEHRSVEHRSVDHRSIGHRSVADRAPGRRAHQPRVLRQHAAGVLRRRRRPPGPPGGELLLVDEQVEHAVRHVESDLVAVPHERDRPTVHRLGGHVPHAEAGGP